MKNKKIYFVIVIIIVVVSIILFVMYKKTDKEKSISIEMVLPSKAVITYDPVFGDVISLTLGDTATFEISTKNINKKQVEYVITDNNVAQIKDNVLTGINSGTTTIYAKDKTGKITSNEIKIKVGEK